MKKERKHNLDKLFLESLGGHQVEPSPGIWESLSSYIPSGGNRGLFLFLASGILIGAFTVFMHSTLIPDPEGYSESNITHTQEVAAEIEIAQAEKTQLNNETVADQSDPSSGTTSSLGFAPEQAISSPSDESEAEFENPIFVNQENLEKGDFSHGFISYIVIPEAEMISNPIEIYSTLESRGSQLRESPDPIFDLNVRDSYAKKADVLFGAAFSPAVNIFPDGQNRNDYSIELVAAYEKSRFLIESGLGANYTSESAKYQVNYTSFDSVGYYVGVTSFTIDPVNPDSVIFETNLKNLYDSIDHYSVTENTNKYAYLQIPLRVGYRVLQTPRFSIDLKAGILFSLQIYKDIPGVPYRGNDADDIEVTRQYPDRLTTSWQYTAGIGLNYQINNKVRFTLEPFYRQYIKSAYSPASAFPARSPHAFGIRGGLYFHF